MGRHKSDAQVNNAPVTVLRGHEEVVSQWKHLQPGDLVKVSSPHPNCHNMSGRKSEQFSAPSHCLCLDMQHVHVVGGALAKGQCMYTLVLLYMVHVLTDCPMHLNKLCDAQPYFSCSAVCTLFETDVATAVPRQSMTCIATGGCRLSDPSRPAVPVILRQR